MCDWISAMWFPFPAGRWNLLRLRRRRKLTQECLLQEFLKWRCTICQQSVSGSIGLIVFLKCFLKHTIDYVIYHLLTSSVIWSLFQYVMLIPEMVLVSLCNVYLIRRYFMSSNDMTNDLNTIRIFDKLHLVFVPKA